jgi:predicted nucleic acid-binding protein
MPVHLIVLDTNDLLSALRSGRGASFRLLELVGGSDRFEINVSVPLVLEYEDVVKRQADVLGLAPRDVDEILDYLCLVANRRSVFFLWRPYLTDPKDDMVLELAVAAGCEFIVTLNQRDFTGIERFGLRTLTPREFLREIGVRS